MPELKFLSYIHRIIGGIIPAFVPSFAFPIALSLPHHTENWTSVYYQGSGARLRETPRQFWHFETLIRYCWGSFSSFMLYRSISMHVFMITGVLKNRDAKVKHLKFEVKYWMLRKIKLLFFVHAYQIDYTLSNIKRRRKKLIKLNLL